MAGRKLAVVVPVLDEAACLGALVERLLVGYTGPFARSEPGDRADLVVVADGGSTDGSREVAERAGAVVLEAPRGRGTQLGAGAERALSALADHDLLFFVHADNLPADGALSALRRAADAGSGAIAWGCRQAVGAQGGFYRAVETLADRRVRRGLVYGDSSLCVTVAAYREAGGFAPLPLFEDLDLSRRLARLGTIALVPDAAVHVSARRWETEGALITVVRNWILTRAYELGVPPRWLVRLYPRQRPVTKDPAKLRQDSTES